MASNQLSVIQKFMKSLDDTTKSGTNALDDAITACSGFKGIQDAIDQMIEDCNKASSADTFLKDYCDIDLDNTDTGAITGADAGGSTIKTAESVITETGTWNYPSGTSFTKRGLTFILPTTIEDDDVGSAEDKRFIIGGIYTWWSEQAIKLIEESYGYSFYDSDVSVKEISIEFYYNDSSDAMLAYTSWHDRDENNHADGKIDKMELNINLARYYNMETSDKNGISPTGEGYLDRTIAHELTHAIMNAKINYSYYLPNFIDEGLPELTHGIDDERKIRINNLAENSELLKSSLDLNKNNKNSESSTNEYAAGYMFLRYLAKQGSTNYPPVAASKSITGTENVDNFDNTISGATISALGGNDWIYNTGSNSVILGGNGNDSIFNHVSNVTISGGKGNDYISNYDGKSKISMVGGAGNDSIFNNTGSNVTISGDTGNDYINLGSSNSKVVMRYAKGDGSDTVYGYNNTDTIYISDEKYSTVNSGNDVNIKIGSNTIYLKNAKGIKLNIKGTYAGSSTTTTISTSTTKSSSATATIKGTTGNDSLKGDSKANTIIGGKGNDTLTGGSGADVFVYASGDGKDIITDYSAGQDKIKITGAKISKTSVSGSDVILTVGSGSIRIKNSKGKTLSIYNNASSLTNTVISSSSTSTTKGSGTSTNTSTSTTLTITNNTSTPVVASSTVTIINANGRTKNVFISANDKANTIIGGSGVNTIIGADGNDLISGGKSGDELYGGKGNDTLIGNEGNDYISANEGNDYVSGGIGNDSLFGGSSNDTLFGIDGKDYISANEGNDYVNGGDGNDELYGGYGRDTIYGEAGNDYISANEDNDYASGGDGNDSIYGGEGNDTLYGDAGNDKIYGSDGNDKIYGGDGSDTIHGGEGNDTMYGGNGKDVFSYYTGDGNDVIVDFTVGTDKLDIVGSYGGASVKGNDVVIKIGSGSLTLKNAASTYDYNYEERWFAEEDNFETNELNFMSENKALASNTIIDNKEFNSAFCILNSALNNRSDKFDSKNTGR